MFGSVLACRHRGLVHGHGVYHTSTDESFEGVFHHGQLWPGLGAHDEEEESPGERTEP